MQRRRSRPIRLVLGITMGAALTLGACGDDDGGGGGSTDAFCDELAKLADAGDDTTEEEDLEAIRAVAEVAPGEISDEMDQLVETFEQILAFDPETASEEEFDEFLAIAGDIEETSIAVEDFARENCPDLPEELFTTE